MPRSERIDPRLPRLAQSPGFVEAIRGGWGPIDRAPTLTPGAAAAGAAHRDRLREALPGERVVVSAGFAPVRSNDTYHEFRADSNFLWLTGLDVEGGIIEIAPDGDTTLFMEPPAKPGEVDFYASATQGELWVGPQPGLAEVAQALGVRTRPIADFLLAPDTLVGGAIAAGPLEGAPVSFRLRESLAGLRMIKDDWEIGQLRAAVRATEEGVAAVVAEIPAAIAQGGERWLQGTFDRVARLRGRGPGYATIVGSAAHAAILHWVRADGPIVPEALLLLDMGVEVNTGYTADVTRTVPAMGAYTGVQRRVYDLVERAHLTGLAAVRPDAPWHDFHAASMEVLARGLHDWGILRVSVDEALAPGGQQHRRYIVCGVGHHLGLDVHDCAASRYEDYQGATLAPGMTLTVEPGLYFQPNDLTLPPELRGIAIRIEDDLLVTETGHELLSDGIPFDALGLEAWVRDLA